jgi:hypothetical protein
VNFIAESATADARAHGEEASQFDETVVERILWRGLKKDSASSNRAGRGQGDGRRVAELEHHGAQGTWQGRGCGWERARWA